MNEIAGRFRSRLGPDWPNPLPELLDAVLAEDARNPEQLIGRILEAWSADETVEQAIRELLAGR